METNNFHLSFDYKSFLLRLALLSSKGISVIIDFKETEQSWLVKYLATNFHILFITVLRYFWTSSQIILVMILMPDDLSDDIDVGKDFDASMLVTISIVTIKIHGLLIRQQRKHFFTLSYIRIYTWKRKCFTLMRFNARDYRSCRLILHEKSQ